MDTALRIPKLEPTLRQKLLDWQRWRLVFLSAIPTLVVFFWFDANYSFGRDMQVSGKRSTPYVLFLIPNQAKTPEVGSLVAFRAERMVAPFKDGMTVIKPIAAGPGDHVVLTKDKLQINGKFIVANEFTRLGEEQGTPVDLQPMNRVLTDDEFFVLGTHPRSYDSRFWGVLERDRVITRVFGIF